MLRGLRSCSREVVDLVVASHGVRAFSSSSVLYKKINIEPFATASGRSISTSKWSLELLGQFCRWEFKSGLGFTKKQLEDIPLMSAPEAFARCPAGKDEITRRECKLDMTGVPAEDTKLVKGHVGAVFAALEEVLRQHERPKPTNPHHKERRPKKPTISMLAFGLLKLCGFCDGEEFMLKCESIEFTLAGKTVNSKADAYMASRTGDSSQFVLIWEDKLRNGTDVTQSLLNNSVAQIIGELMSVHYHNHLAKYEPVEVYAIRLIDDMVAFFRMEMTAEQIKAVCEDGVVPEPKLQVDYLPKHALDASGKYGVSLLHPVGRDLFVRMMACIRAEILKREVREPVPFKTQKSGEAPDFDNMFAE
eukprot:Rhum_TRINITY_DN15340_c1_g3::Rhum_TRINITY_DN15340_c1_g3_i2::g.149655::m.149655